MRTIILSTILIVLGQEVYSQTNCQNSCQDFLGTPMCTVMKSKCGSTSTSFFCQRTCKICSSCVDQRKLKTNVQLDCELGQCSDARGPVWCGVINQGIKDGCIIFGNQCRASCGLCKPCDLPPTELACTKDCKDSDPKTCVYWKKKGYCAAKKGFPHTRIACPMSCGTCKLCPTEVPIKTTTQPTITSKACEKCEDTNKFCSHWKDEGYCNVKKGFPDMLKACPKACEICTPCSNIK